ncbi:MAG: hypothetical protein KJO25_08770, partial [Bacteroidia bacterium]|nr:hypothetical protein [Bacteroidia bacterium]
MSTIIKVALASFLLLNSACNSAKDPADNSTTEAENKTVTMERDWQKEGFVKAMIKQNKDKGCPLILVLDKTGEAIDPINIDAEPFAAMRKPETEVYIKFRRLRMPN